MSTQALSIAQAAEELGVSTRTIRRFIKAGKLKAELINGTFGPEYRIREIPAELKKGTGEAEKEGDPEPETRTETPAEIAIPSHPAETPDNILVMLKDLQDKNMVLAAQLGAATERIRNLETQVKQIAAPAPSTTSTSSEATVKKSWWQRLMSVFRG